MNRYVCPTCGGLECCPPRAVTPAAQGRIAALEEALRFYAEPDKYTDCHENDVQIPDFYSELDFGKTARAALKGGE